MVVVVIVVVRTEAVLVMNPPAEISLVVVAVVVTTTAEVVVVFHTVNLLIGVIREKVWFPGADKKVESCILCLACVPSTAQREPLSMTTLPSGPWMEAAVDLAGPFPSGEYPLVVIDDYSWFPEVDVISSTAAEN